MMTGEDRYLTYAKAGLDWINTKAKDPVYGGYYGRLTINGDPVDPNADKDVFDLASLGLAYGMYFNVTRDPAAEADLLAVRDLIFDKYYDAAGNRVKDALTYDLAGSTRPGDTDSHPRRDHAPRAQGRRGRVRWDRRGGSPSLSQAKGAFMDSRTPNRSPATSTSKPPADNTSCVTGPSERR